MILALEILSVWVLLGVFVVAVFHGFIKGGRA